MSCSNSRGEAHPDVGQRCMPVTASSQVNKLKRTTKKASLGLRHQNMRQLKSFLTLVSVSDSWLQSYLDHMGILPQPITRANFILLSMVERKKVFACFVSTSTTQEALKDLIMSLTLRVRPLRLLLRPCPHSAGEGSFKM